MSVSNDRQISVNGGFATPAVYRVRLFGSFHVMAPDGTDATPTGRKARAVLAHLLMAGGTPVLRERLAALLWSERAEEQARASLRQALQELRALSVGDQPLLSIDRGEARVARDQAATDLDRLRHVAAQGDAQGLAELLGGRLPVLLDDLNGIDPAFDDWLAGERQRRGDELRSLTLAVAEQALTSGDVDAAHRLGTAALAGDPLDEAAARLTMQACHRRGDKDSVRLIHGRLASALQSELGAQPAEETAELHRRLMAAPTPTPTDGGRVALTARRTAPPMTTAPPPATVAAPRLPRRPRWLARAVGAAAAVGVLLTLAGVVAVRHGGGATQRVLAVEPLLVAADDGAARALGHGLATEMARMIVGNDAVLNVTDAVHAPPHERPAADYVLTGEAQNQGGVIHADIKLSRGDDPRRAILWSHAFTRSAAEIDALREQVATKVADVAVCALGGRNPEVEQLGMETMRLFFTACEQKHGDWAESAKLLEQVVARQPGFARGWAMLSAATATMADLRPDEAAALYRQADVYARHAIALNPNDGEAYYARAEALPGIDHWAARMEVLQAGHAVDPTNAPTNAMLATELASIGRLHEALPYGQRGSEFDPFSPGQTWVLSGLLAFSDDVAGANAVMLVARKRFPAVDYVARNEFWLSAVIGDARHAADMLVDPQRGFEFLPEHRARWRTVLAARLEPSPAHVGAAVDALLDPAGEPNHRGTHLLADLVRLGRADLALRQADQMTPEDLAHSTAVLFSAVMAPLRADPRFMALATRAGLTPIWVQSGKWPDFCADHSLPYDCRTEARKVMAAPAAVPPPGA